MTPESTTRASPPDRATAARRVHQHPAHDLGSDRVEVQPVLPRDGAIRGVAARQTQKGFVHERGRLEEVPRCLMPHAGVR